MATKVLVPLLGEGVEEVTVIKWLKKEGDSVNELEPLLEVNTDKVDTEIPAPASGMVLKILAEEGVPAKVGTILAFIGKPGETVESGGVESVAQVKSTVSSEQLSVEQSPTQHAVRSTDLGFISPVVAKIAAEHGVNLQEVTGTGLNGRITKNDVLIFVVSLNRRACSFRLRVGDSAIERASWLILMGVSVSSEVRGIGGTGSVPVSGAGGRQACDRQRIKLSYQKAPCHATDVRGNGRSRARRGAIAPPDPESPSMPPYEYQCRNCGHTMEEFQSMTEEPLVICPECRTDNLVRVMGAGAGLIFKESGFYLTDYRKPAPTSPDSRPKPSSGTPSSSGGTTPAKG